MGTKRMFEFVEGTSRKFWEVWIDGAKVMTRYGRIGTAGQITVKDEGSVAAAQKLHDKLIGEKTRKGYGEIGESAATPTAATDTHAGGFDARLDAIEAAARKRKVKLPKGASPKAIAAAEKTLGVTFPAEVTAFYLRHDGGGHDAYLCDGRELLSLARVVSEWKVWKHLLDEGDFGDNDHGTPDRGVQKKWWIPGWIPFTYDGAGNHHIIDLAPAKGGKVGQILSFWHDDDPRTVEAPDLLTWLAEKAAWGDPDEIDDDEDAEVDDVDEAPPAKVASKPASKAASKPASKAASKPASKAASKAVKLPASLKVDVYADVVAASPELIVAGSTSGAALAAWSEQGVTKIDKPFQPGLPFRCGPAASGLAVLPGLQFLMASRAVNYDGTQYDSQVALFESDGLLVSKPVSEPGREFDAMAVSPDGTLAAVASAKDGKGRVSIWEVQDLAGGAAARRTAEGHFLQALTFTADGKEVVFHFQDKLVFVPVAGGAVREVSTDCAVESASVISAADGVICVSDGSAAALLTPAGKTLLDLPKPCFDEKRGLVAEHAMVAPDGTVIGVAGDLGKHYSRDFFAGVKLPDPAMAQGFVAAIDRRGKLLGWKPRAKNKPVRAMALAVGRAVVIGQDGLAEIAPWPLG